MYPPKRKFLAPFKWRKKKRTKLFQQYVNNDSNENNKVSTNFDLKELSKLKVTKASGPDGITARLLKDAAPVIAKPRLTWLTLLFQQDLFQLSGRMQQ